MIHIQSSSIAWEEKTGYGKKVYLTSEQLRQTGARVQTLKIKPGQSADIHYHKKQTEIFYFPEANGDFVINGKRMELRAGDVLVVEPGDRHTAINTSDHDFVYVCFKMSYHNADFFED